MPSTFNMSDVMLSYSRRDKTFVQRLEQALRATGREIWVDWLDIPPTVDFLQEIYAGIEAANTFVFVISPDSARSEVCGLEVQRAVELNKRLVPVLHRDLSQEELAKLHPAVASHNWIYVREQDNFDSGFKTLVDALETDVEHVQLHTKLLVLAHEWESEGHNGAFLLRGEELKDAELWLTGSVNRKPEPTALQAEYIAASRKAAARNRQVIVGALSTALVILSFLALFAFQQSAAANTQLGISNERGTEVANALSTAQANENARATAQDDADHEQQRANDNATLSADNASTAAYSLLTAVAAQDLANSNLATATFAQGQAQDALSTAQAAQASADAAQATAFSIQQTADAAQGTADAAVIAAEAAQGTADANLATANAARGTAQAAQSTANSALATGQAAQATANAANLLAAQAQMTVSAASVQAIHAQETAVAAQKTAIYEQGQAAIAKGEAAVAKGEAAQAKIDAANAEATAEVEQTRAAVEALNAQSLALAANAQGELLKGNRPFAMSLALIAATMVDDPQEEVLTVLKNVAISKGIRYPLPACSRSNSGVDAVGMTSAQVYTINSYVLANNNSNSDICRWDISGTNGIIPTPSVTHLDVGGRNAFSPDGTKIILAENKQGGKIYIYKADGTLENSAVFEEVLPFDVALLDDNKTFIVSGLTKESGYSSEVKIYVGHFTNASTYTAEVLIGTDKLSAVEGVSIIPGVSNNLEDTVVYLLLQFGNEPTIRLVKWTYNPKNQSPKLDWYKGGFSQWEDAVFSPVPGDRHILFTDLGSINYASYVIQFEGSPSSQYIDYHVRDYLLFSPSVSKMAYKLSDYSLYGSSGAVVKQLQNNASVLDISVSDTVLPSNSAQSLIDWVCANRYWQHLSVDPTDRPSEVTQLMVDKMVTRCANAPATSAEFSAQNALFDTEPALEPILTPTPFPIETFTPTVEITPSLTPTIDPYAPVRIDASDAQVSLSGAWQSIEYPDANGGSYLISGAPDDSMGLIFEGTAISIIYFQHPAMGSFNVELDGVALGSVRETGDVIRFRQVPISGLAPGFHTLRIIPAQSPVVIDAFVVNPPIDWLPGTIVTATFTPTPDITLTPTQTLTPSLTPETPVDVPVVVPPENPVDGVTITPTETLVITETPTLTPTATETWIITDTPTPTATIEMPPVVEVTAEPLIPVAVEIEPPSATLTSPETTP
jgi:hypothetical protein